MEPSGGQRTAEQFADFEVLAHIRRLSDLSWKLIAQLKVIWSTSVYSEVTTIMEECNLTVCKDG